MEIPDAIVKRKCIRAFMDRDLSDAEIVTLVEAAVRAPSAGNMQPWGFVAVKSREVKARLSEAAKQPWMASAPVVFVVCTEAARTAPRYGERGTSLYMFQDTAAAVEHILLTAAGNGLGGTWMGAFDETAVSGILSLPPGLRPVAMVPVGYPAQDPAPRPRRPVSEVLHWEKW